MTLIVGLEKGRHDAGDLLRGPDALVDLVGIVIEYAITNDDLLWLPFVIFMMLMG